jgi:hypothetical protein
MEKIELKKRPLLKMFFFQFGDILAIEIGLLICFLFGDIPFLYVLQLAVIPVFLYLIITKYTKSVTTIKIDIQNQRINLCVNYFLIYNKCYDLPFKEIEIKIRNKWLLRYYYEVIEIKLNNKNIAVIPYQISIWNKEDLDKLKDLFKDLEKENLINVIRHKGKS